MRHDRPKLESMDAVEGVRSLVSGDVNGNFRSLFTKVDSILTKKGPFEYLFCVGDFFGSNSAEWEDLKSGKIKVPLTTYILGANVPSHEEFYCSLHLIPNIDCLGKKGCLTGSSGLKVAYLSGTEQPGNEKHSDNSDKCGKKTIYFSKQDVIDLIKSLESKAVIDILLTSEWPRGVSKYAVTSDDRIRTIQGSALISKLAKDLKPRYHFCGLSGFHYERHPYRNHAELQETPLHLTRFFALAPVNNTLKHKWLYAFNITPACFLSNEELRKVFGPATVCPYGSDELNENVPQCQFFFSAADTGSSKKRVGEEKDQCQNPVKKLSIDSTTCWFCLSNSKVERQLIISIGNHCYVTLAKGLLVPEHSLIVPVRHAVSSVELSSFIFEEIEKYKISFAEYFHDKGKDVVFFERNYCSPHLQVQVVPVPKQHKVEIQDSLFAAAKQYNLNFTELPNFSNVQQVVSPKQPYFYFEVMINKKTEAKYLYIIKEKFPLQFGRIVLAKVLNVTDRVDWRKCQDSESVEKEMADEMKKQFSSYEFT